MADFFLHMEGWHWLVIGLLLLGAETLGIGGFMIGMGVAALIQGFISSTFELSGGTQLTIYAINSAVLSVLYWKFFRKYNEDTDTPNINDRASALIGRKVTLKEEIDEQGRIQIGDTLWNVTTEGVLKKGTKVKVIGNEGMTLIIK